MASHFILNVFLSGFNNHSNRAAGEDASKDEWWRVEDSEALLNDTPEMKMVCSWQIRIYVSIAAKQTVASTGTYASRTRRTRGMG